MKSGKLLAGPGRREPLPMGSMGRAFPEFGKNKF